MSEQIGKHKGAVETLLHEKKELSRILQIVNSQLQRHLNALEEAGVDTDQFIEEIQQGAQSQEQQTQQKRETQQEQRQQKKRERSQTADSSARESSEEADPDELLEGDNNISDRDFNPNR